MAKSLVENLTASFDPEKYTDTYRSELMELIGLCHRVAVMRAGRLQTTLAADHLTEEELIAHATGTH